VILDSYGRDVLAFEYCTTSRRWVQQTLWVNILHSLLYLLTLLVSLDWAYLEEWCRRLTGNFSDVYVFTVPLYLPRLGNDGKWRVVCSNRSFVFDTIFMTLVDP
jgi:hypothetical protein